LAKGISDQLTAHDQKIPNRKKPTTMTTMQHPTAPISSKNPLKIKAYFLLMESGLLPGRARQAFLRKNYQDVVMDRSPTISLSAMKRNKQKSWFKYLSHQL
jgi:hypothetical protein